MIAPVTQPQMPAEREMPPPNPAETLSDTSGPMFHRSASAEKTDWEHEYPLLNRASAISVKFIFNLSLASIRACLFRVHAGALPTHQAILVNPELRERESTFEKGPPGGAASRANIP